MNIYDKYEVKKQLGEGSFGRVFHAIRKTDGMNVAIKVIKKSKIKESELNIMKIIDQDCSVKYIEEFDDNDGKHDVKFIVMSYFNGYDFFDFVSNCFDTSEEYRNKVLLWFVELKDCIDSLHKKGIYHRDIKPENIMLNNNIPKLVDYGLSFYDDGKSEPDFVGSPNFYDKFYLSQKGLSREEKIQVLRFHDYYCLIATIYSLLTNKLLARAFNPPNKNFLTEYKKEYIFHIKNGDNFIVEYNIKSPFMELVRFMINFIKKNNKVELQFFETVDRFVKMIK